MSQCKEKNKNIQIQQHMTFLNEQLDERTAVANILDRAADDEDEEHGQEEGKQNSQNDLLLPGQQAVNWRQRGNHDERVTLRTHPVKHSVTHV